MAPALALLLCTFFVLILLLVERRESRDVSAAAWIPTVWMLSVNSKALSFWLGVTGGSSEGGSPMDRLLLTGLAVAGVAVLARRWPGWSGALRGQGWLLALLAYQFVSTSWSDIPYIALRRWVREAIVVGMALVIMSEANPRQALQSVLRRAFYILVPFSLMLIDYYPALGRAYARWSGGQMWTGVAYQKNSLGALCMVATLFLLWALYRRWREPNHAGGRYRTLADASVVLIALFILKGPESSYSATSVGSLAIGIGAVLGLRLLRKWKRSVSQPALVAILLLSISFGASAPFMGGSNVAIFSSSLGRDESLTGRTEIWASLVPVVARDPLFGHGFASFWTDERKELFQAPHAHNAYLDVLLDLGAVGLAFYVAWLWSCARRFHRTLAQDFDWATLGIGLLFILALYGTTESVLEDLSAKVSAVLVLVSLVAPQTLTHSFQPGHLEGVVPKRPRAQFRRRQSK